ncbi:MAG: hypothetical protein PHF31_12850 [Methylobacter sp.]|nr:hypothetical protein [Methylobacter sp.]
MKTTKQNLTAIAMGVAVAMGSVSTASASVGVDTPIHPSIVSAFAGLVAELSPLSKNPIFDPSERTGIALVESSLSLIAARTHIDPVTCAEKWYKVSVDATGETEGTAKISDSDGDVTTLDAVLTQASLGAQVDVTAEPGASLFGAAIKDYKGDHQWSRQNNIFLDHATWNFKHPQSGRLIPYDEHSIKDYYSRNVVGDLAAPLLGTWVFDAGIEVITKKNFPVTKWGELSWYRQQDGGEGVLRVVKTLVKKNITCQIEFEATGNFPFQFDGAAHVHKFIIPGLPAPI